MRFLGLADAVHVDFISSSARAASIVSGHARGRRGTDCASSRDGKECVMQLPNNDNSSAAPPVGVRRCPMCGKPMFLLSIEPADKQDHDQRTFECSSCPYAETTVVKIEEATG
jgi:hypothetical protein